MGVLKINNKAQTVPGHWRFRLQSSMTGNVGLRGGNGG